MTRRGFIETNPRFHARWVLPGYDADDPDVPPNKVVFDSDVAANLSVLAMGDTVIPLPSNGIVLDYTIATWDYPFVPFCLFQFRDQFEDANRWSNTYVDRNFGTPSKLIVSTTGIRGWLSPSPWGTTLTIRWVAFRLAAT